MKQNEVFIYLEITDFNCNFLDIEKELGIKFHKNWNKGDRKIPNAIIKYKTNGCYYEIRRKNLLYVDDEIEKI